MPRCWWAGDDPDYVAYHDTEWGRPVTDDRALFEKLCLEGFQAGLSWLTILRKRPRFREAFAGFDPAVVAGFGAADVERLLSDAGIVRNRAKVEATIGNARAMLGIESLSELVWSFAPSPGPAPRTPADIPAQTPESVALSKELKRNGFRFVGPTTCYAFMHYNGSPVQDGERAQRARPTGRDDVPTSTPESAAMAKELKARGFRFVGPVSCYAFMQSVGMVNDHVVGCEIGDTL